MSAKTRLPLTDATVLAEEVRDLLAPFCARLEIAGSIRRQRDTIGDIELVAIPTLLAQPDLFGTEGAGEPRNLLAERVGALLGLEVLTPRLNKLGRQSLGPQNKLLLFKGFALDLFITDAERWGVTFAIRTGGREFSHVLVTPVNQDAKEEETGRSLGPGLCPVWLQVKGWRVRHRSTQEPYDTPEEEDVFRMLGVPLIPPEERDAYLEARLAAGVRR
jgi:DNA polymerase/3'-5' exonuclease PolX